MATRVIITGTMYETGNADGIWGPTDPRPENPIVIPPGTTIPPGTWGGGNVPMPNPPIYIPPCSGSGGGTQPPPEIWKPVFPTPPINLNPDRPVVLPPLFPTHPIVIFPGGGAEPPRLELWPPVVDNSLPDEPPHVDNTLPYTKVWSLVAGWALVQLKEKKK